MSATSRRRTVRLGAALSLPLLLVLSACSGASGNDAEEDAASYPEDNVEVVVPFAAGGPTDTVTRLVADPMGEDLGTQLIVQNVEGAGGTIGAEDVADADPDGYTVLMHHIGMSTAPTLYPDLAYDPETDFKPIGLVTEVPMTILSRTDLGPQNMDELVTYLEQNAATATLAHAGIGSASNLCAELIENAIGLELQQVAYDGTGPALTDLVGGQVDVMCDQTTNTTGQINGGQVQAYAVTTPERVATLPDLPTTAEAGLPDLEVSVWHGLYVPAETSDEIVTQLNDALLVALQDQNVIDQLAALGTAPVTPDRATPAEHARVLQEQIALWAGVLEPTGA